MKNAIRMRFPGGKSKAFTMSYDDGVQQDIRMIELMQRSGVKGTFNINSESFAAEGTVYPADQVHRRMTKSECTALYADSGMEVACHATQHGFLEHLPLSTAVLQIVKDREQLEETYGTIVRGFAYPYGTYNDAVVDALRMCGVAYARTTKSTHSFDLPTDWLRLHPTCHHRDAQLGELTERFLSEEPQRDPWLFYLWGHTYEFDGANNWDLIEAFLPRIGGHEQVWYATNIEIYEYVCAYQTLIFAANGTLVTNPTVTDVYALVDGATVCIPAGCKNMKL